MNKKLLLAGAVAVAGFFALTAFNGKTLAQQKEEIAAAVTAQLESLRTEMAAECDARVATEANARFDAWMAEMAAKPAAKPMKGAVKKSVPSGPNVDPLPAGTTPKPTTPEDKAKSRMQGESGTQNEEAAKSRMEGQPAVKEEEKAKGRMKSGGGN
jgi:hypothetical protein